jgi:hypothetical protein
MAALTASRPVFEKYDPTWQREDFPATDSTQYFKGGLVALVAGLLVKPTTATVGASSVWLCEDEILTGVGTTKKIGVRSGIYKFTNVGGITAADVGKICYVSDDQSVTLTGAPGTDVVVGNVEGVDTGTASPNSGVLAAGVWVRLLGFREAIPTAAVVTGS